MNVGDLKKLISDLPDDMPVDVLDAVGESCCPVIFVNDFADVTTEPKPPTTLCISVG